MCYTDFRVLSSVMDFYNFLSFTEYNNIAIATAIGFCIMGFLGYFIKLIHIPINNIIV